MTSSESVGRRSAQAGIYARAASHTTIQPPSWQAAPLHWAKATAAWANREANASYVDCNPCKDAAGTDEDTDIILRVFLPRTPGTDPNVVADQVLGYMSTTDGVHVAVTGYLDDAIGTIKMWALDTGDPPEGWTECKSGGTSGRYAPSVAGLEGTFPVGRKGGDSDFAAVGDTGNLNTKTHCHPILKDAQASACGEVSVSEGTWDSITLTVSTANHLPPWCVVRFIERYDNSAS